MSAKQKGKTVPGDETQSDAPVLIKKYANRRLYDTARGEFVTLGDLHEMVKRGDEFRVEDVKSGTDITCSVLAQIIAEEESKGEGMLPLNYLRQVLKFYGDGFGGEFATFLERSAESFATGHRQMLDQMQGMMGAADPVEQMAELGRRNLELFQKSLGAFAAGGGAQEPPPDGESAREAEIEKLKGELAEIQRRLDRLTREQ